MKNTHFIAAVAALVLSVGGTAAAESIYKWVDEDGNVHYEDRPSGAESEERIHVTYNRTSSSAVQSRVNSFNDSQQARRDAGKAADEAKAAADEERAVAEQRQQKCVDTRAQLKTMLEARRLYREDAEGERVYLDDAGREEARQRAEELIEEYCN
ncbi:MAG: DUF4124 domain-containing protein [Gammaproteobacteria bacterium]|nr:DUF4124 domain-containing protein [Gammaproteobacteria bacterium]